jgi:NitT/TauT family transport system substrate-binding protein
VKRVHERFSHNATWLLGTVACALAWVTHATTTLADPVKIRVDWTVVPGQFAPLIPEVPNYAPGVYRHYGKSYIVEPLKFEGGGATLTALAVGETDISTMSPQSLVLAVTNAKLDVRVIGQQISTEVPGYLHTYFWVKADKIRTIGELKEKVVGVNARGSAPDSAIEIMLLRHNLKPPGDYQILELPFPSQLPALKADKIDLGVVIPPFNLEAEADPSLKPLFSIGDVFGPLETSMWVGRADFIQDHRAAIVDFLEDNIRMRQWMFDPKTRGDAIRELSAVSKLSAARFENWVYTHKDYYYDPNAMVDLARLQRNIDDIKAAGIVPAAINASSYADLSLVREAAARVER